ncbi:hypothetical protein RvY_00818 [Ramazzottius varieornatus]|uniref:Uncharacterized protein n=1 Tax=Ramazzottius varieornatus TaxID=947166 RepID=A0A1D1UHR7_RAMVA|nr:hypothetical protein RvY_00818 [Ramazzottius varieornatus]
MLEPSSLDKESYGDASQNNLGTRVRLLTKARRYTKASPYFWRVEACRVASRHKFGSMVQMRTADYLHVLGIGHIFLGILAFLVQIGVNFMCQQYTIYDWHYDAPTLAKSAIGIIAAITYIVQGVLCIGAGKFVTGSYLPDLTEHFRVLKILNAVAVLMSSSLLGVTGYLVYVLSLWWAFYEEHLDYIKGPVLVTLTLNMIQIGVGILELSLAFAGFFIKNENVSSFRGRKHHAIISSVPRPPTTTDPQSSPDVPIESDFPQANSQQRLLPADYSPQSSIDV